MAAPSDWTDPEAFVLRLYVAGQMPRSLRAVVNTQKLCAEDLHGIYRLEVIDLYQQPQLAQGEEIVALPALIRRLPRPTRVVVGDMSDTAAILATLNLKSE